MPGNIAQGPQSLTVAPCASGCSGTVEALLDCGRDGLDLCAQLLLDAEEVEAVVVGDEVHRQAQVPKTPGAAHTVQVGL